MTLALGSTTDPATAGLYGRSSLADSHESPPGSRSGLFGGLARYVEVDGYSTFLGGGSSERESESTTSSAYPDLMQRRTILSVGHYITPRLPTVLACDTFFRQLGYGIDAPRSATSLDALEDLRRSLGKYPARRIVDRLITTGVARHAAAVASALRRYFASQEISIGDGSSGYVVCLTVSDPRSVADSYEDLNRFLFDWWAVQDFTTREKVEVALA